MFNIRNFSPSGINTLKECPMKFFLGYGLNYYAPTPWHSTVIGTTCHHVLELVAKAKILAKKGKKWEKDKIFGRVYADKYPINDWKTKLYKHYTEKEKHLIWDNDNWEDFCERLNKALIDDWSPTNIEPERFEETELKVELPIEEEWAKEFSDENGVLHKHLKLKGFVDLIFRGDNDTLIFRDYKFGKNPPKNWDTGRVKTFDDLMQDVQMCIYYHTVKRVYEEEPVGHLWYAATKTPRKYVLPIDDDYVKIVFDDVGKLYEQLKKTKQLDRKANRDRMGCVRLKCPFSTMNFNDFGRPELDVDHNFSRDSFDAINGKACVCDATTYFNKYRTPEEIQEKCKKKYDR